MEFHETDLLANLVRARHGCLTQLAALGGRQGELIAAGDFSELIALLNSKQRVLAVLGDVERRLAPFRGQAPQDRRWRTPADRQACAAIVAESESLLAEVLLLERESESRLRDRRDELKQRLDGSHAAGAARRAYAARPARGEHQLDMASEA